jgi:hypothetical protein
VLVHWKGTLLFPRSPISTRFDGSSFRFRMSFSRDVSRKPSPPSSGHTKREDADCGTTRNVAAVALLR